MRELLDYVSQYNLRNKTVRATAVGDYFESKQLIINLAWVLGVSVLLLYFILSAQFERDAKAMYYRLSSYSQTDPVDKGTIVTKAYHPGC